MPAATQKGIAHKKCVLSTKVDTFMKQYTSFQEEQQKLQRPYQEIQVLLADDRVCFFLRSRPMLTPFTRPHAFLVS